MVDKAFFDSCGSDLKKFISILEADLKSPSNNSSVLPN